MIFQGLSRTRTWHFFLIFNVIFKLSSIMNGNIAKMTNGLIGRACKCVFSPLSYFLQDMKMTFSQLFMTTQAFSWDFPLSLDQTQEVGQGKTTFCVVSKPTFCKSNVEIVQDGLVTVLMWLAVTSPKVGWLLPLGQYCFDFTWNMEITHRLEKCFTDFSSWYNQKYTAARTGFHFKKSEQMHEWQLSQITFKCIRETRKNKTWFTNLKIFQLTTKSGSPKSGKYQIKQLQLAIWKLKKE